MADFGGDTELEAFRADTRAWLEANFPPSLRSGEAAATEATMLAPPTGDALLWKERVVSKGWGVPAWPVEYGGAGLSPAQVTVLQQEMNRIGATNPIRNATGMGSHMIGPTILEYGTEDQKRRHLLPIARGERRWCLGYSEPGAGSDLASLSTRAEDAGDHFLVNGQKIWTSGANHSDWCGALMRTDPNVPKHDGISFILIDMRQPGVEARQIMMAAGGAGFCEVFFTNARAEKDDLLGPPNGGWSVGKRLLQFERSGQTGAAGGAWADTTEPLADVARRYIGLGADGRLADSDMRARLTAHLIDAHAHNLTLARVAAETKAGGGSANGASVLKNSASLVGQTRTELAVEIMGMRGLGWEGEGFTEDELSTTRRVLRQKTQSVVGGTFEVQYNVISKRILGLPDMTKSS